MPELKNAIAVREAVGDTKQRDFVHKLLAELLITLADQYYLNQSFFIDGYRFINCRFDNCNLWVMRGTFELHHCTLVGGSRIYDQEALKCVQLFDPNHPNPVFKPKSYPDGSISVAKGVSFQ